MFGSAGRFGSGQDLPQRSVTPRRLEPSGPAAQAPQPRPQPGAGPGAPDPTRSSGSSSTPLFPQDRGLLHTFVEAGKSDLGNEKFALKM